MEGDFTVLSVTDRIDKKLIKKIKDEKDTTNRNGNYRTLYPITA